MCARGTILDQRASRIRIFLMPTARAESLWGRSMGRLRQGVPVIVLLLALECAGCGGGAASFSQPPPPPAADFSIGLSPSSVSVLQGATSPAINITVNGLNGFTGSVQIALSTLPAGVTSNPLSPFAVAAGATVPIHIGAAANAATGNFTISAEGTSGGLSHGANLTVTIQSAVGAALPRTAYAKTDSTSAADDPFGEPHHRHMAYDPVNKHLFVANRAMNRVEVFSTFDQSQAAQVSIAGASSADLSADGVTVWIGTSLQEIVAIDAATLHLKARYLLDGLRPLPGISFNRPVEVLSLSNGKAMIRLRQPDSSQALLALWDPSSNSLTNLTSNAPVVFQQGAGVLARSGDHSRVLAAANDSSGELAMFDGMGNVVAGPRTLGAGLIQPVSANQDGTRFAVVIASNGGAQLSILDAALNPIGFYSPSNVHGVTFSRDGKYLYISEPSSSGSIVSVLDGRTAQPVGRVSDAMVQGLSSEIEDADESQLLFGLSNRGVSFVDAATPMTLSSPGPILAVAPSLQPAEGANSGGTPITLTGQNFSSSVRMKLGTQLASNVSVPVPTQIQANSPTSVSNGPVNVTAFFDNGWLALAPDAFSYGPQILQILPNAGSNSGGDLVQIYGYGFGSDATKITVKIGAANATVTKIESITGIAPSLGLDASYPFPLERITIQSPPGPPRKADVVIASPAGSATSAKSFQYLQSAQSYSKPGFFRFLLYDQARQRIYLTNIDHVDAFDLQLNSFALQFNPPGGPPPNAGLRGMALTPDGSQLIVADFGAQKIYLLDPVNGLGTIVPVGGVPGFINSGPARVAATSAQTVFVGLSGEGGSGGACSTCLAQLNLATSPPTIQPAPQPEVTSLTGAPLVQSDATGDRVFVSFGSSPSGPLAVWDASVPNRFVTSTANVSVSDLGAALDGTMFALQGSGAAEIRTSDLSLAAVPASAELTQIPGRVFVPGLAMHPSGALLYQPFLTGAPGSAGVKGGVDILDARSGALRLRIFLPQQLMTDVDGLHGCFLATDENGQRLFAITSSDGTPQHAALSIIQLASVPLGIGSVSPLTVSASGGTTVTIRGSGFQSATAVSISGKPASVSFKSANMLTVVIPSLTAGPQRITITNPDGETIALEAALTAN